MKIVPVFTIIFALSQSILAAPRPDILSALRGNIGNSQWGLNPEAYKENLKVKEAEVDEVLR